MLKWRSVRSGGSHLPRSATRNAETVTLAVILIVILVVAEIGARYWLLVNTPPTWSQWHIGRPLAMVNTPNYSTAFLEEQARFYATWTWPGENVEPSGDFHGHWYNLSGGIRATTDQPTQAANTLYLFGNSTLANIDEPDNYTVASYLQRDFGNAYRVVNLGVPSHAANQLDRLKLLSLKRGDIVVMYNGYAEASAGFVNESPCPIPLQAIGLMQVACAAFYHPVLAASSVSARDVADYESLIHQANSYTQQHGASFYYFLQAQLWSKPLSTYEQIIASNPNLTAPGWSQHVRAIWPAYEEMVQRLRANGVCATNLTHILDAQRGAGNELYIDDAHVNEHGNQIIARGLHDVLTTF